MTPSPTKVRISDDALALACGADSVAAAFAAAGCTLERVSSWGMHWLEPLGARGGNPGGGPAGGGRGRGFRPRHSGRCRRNP